MPAISALLLGSMLYSSRLVPGSFPCSELIGAPVLIVAITTGMPAAGTGPVYHDVTA